MKPMHRIVVRIVFVFALLMVIPSQLREVNAQEKELDGRSITGTVYFLGGRTASRSLPFRLIVNSLTSDEDVRLLTTALQAGGQDELLKRLSRMKAGRIEIGSGVGVVANAIIASREGDRTKVTVLYQRDLHFGELRFGTRSADYRFGFVELYLGPGGNQGMLIPAAMVRLKGQNTWEVEDFGTFPAKLLGLQLRGKGRGEIR